MSVPLSTAQAVPGMQDSSITIASASEAIRVFKLRFIKTPLSMCANMQSL
jgi:hypothetical protein